VVMGIIDYMRQYDFVKKMERMGKSVGAFAFVCGCVCVCVVCLCVLLCVSRVLRVSEKFKSKRATLTKHCQYTHTNFLKYTQVCLPAKPSQRSSSHRNTVEGTHTYTHTRSLLVSVFFSLSLTHTHKHKHTHTHKHARNPGLRTPWRSILW